MQKQRPKFLDIPNIRLPIPGIVSILHRITGIGMFIFLPVLLWFFAGTLDREASFQTYQGFVANPFVKIILIGLLWAYLHHAFAGLRFLFLDVHSGIELQSARKTAKIVAFSAPVVALILGVCLW